MKKGFLTSIFICLFFSFAFGQEVKEEDFTDYINNDRNGSSFDEAIVLKNICDYSQCKTEDCLRDVFNKTILAQELDYVTKKYGRRQEDWEVVGTDAVQVYTLTKRSYYDDLGIQIFSTGQTKVLHFDITSPYDALMDKLYQIR